MDAIKEHWDLIRRFSVIFGIMLGMFVTALNTTVIAPAMTIIATDLGSPDQQAWIATAYLLAFVTCQALAGKVCVHRIILTHTIYSATKSFLISLAGTPLNNYQQTKTPSLIFNY